MLPLDSDTQGALVAPGAVSLFCASFSKTPDMNPPLHFDFATPFHPNLLHKLLECFASRSRWFVFFDRPRALLDRKIKTPRPGSECERQPHQDEVACKNPGGLARR